MQNLSQLDTFLSRGGMRGIEEDALRQMRESGLRVLLAVQREYGEVMDPTQGVVLSGEIRRLQRLLGVEPTKQERQEQAREQARQWQRLRQDHTDADLPGPPPSPRGR